MSDRTSRHSLCDVECQIKCQILTESSGCRIACQNRFHTERQNSCQIKNQKRSEYFLRWGSHEVKQFWQLMNRSSQAFSIPWCYQTALFCCWILIVLYFPFSRRHITCRILPYHIPGQPVKPWKNKKLFFTHRQDSDDSKSSTSDPDGSRSVGRPAWQCRGSIDFDSAQAALHIDFISGGMALAAHMHTLTHCIQSSFLLW